MQIDEADGKIVIPWSVMEGYPYEQILTVTMEEMNRDLGCIKVILNRFVSINT